MANFLFTTVITKNFANKDLTAMETGDTDKLNTYALRLIFLLKSLNIGN